jgi:hypothetical protein
LLVDLLSTLQREVSYLPWRYSENIGILLSMDL